jgi:hypothetical protein
MAAVFLCVFAVPDYTHNRILLGLTTPLQNVGKSGLLGLLATASFYLHDVRCPGIQ